MCRSPQPRRARVIRTTSGERAVEARSEVGWHLAAATVRGASHVRSGQPNQDALNWRPAAGSGPPVAAAVSDGHGGAKYLRSHVGSRFAVAAALKLLWELVQRHADASLA